MTMPMPTASSSKRRADGSPTQSTSVDDTRDIKRPRLDDSGNQPRHLVNRPEPRLAPFHPEFKNVEKAVTKACDTVLEVHHIMTQAGHHNVALTRTCEAIRKYRNPAQHYPPQQPTAVVGTSGVGKSSLFNTLFGIGEIAITSEALRGTDVVLEAAAADMYQQTPFLVEARYHPRERIERQVEQQCRSSFTLFDKRKQRDEDADDVDEDELADLEDCHSTALEYLDTTLHDPNDEDFESEAAIEKWLHKRWLDGTGPGDVVMDIMHKINDFLNERGVRNDREVHPAMSTSDLQDVYEQISSPSAAKGIRRHPCRLIHVIRLRFEHPLLESGSILADTPGFGDGNRFVANIARDYLSIAGHIFLVTPILRTDSALLDPYLSKIIQMRKANKSYLIVTKIDDKDKKCGKISGGELSEDEAKVEEARLHKMKLEASKSELVGEKKRLRAARRSQECGQLQQKIDDLDEELETAQKTLERARNTAFQNSVLSRNALVMPGLKDKYRKLARSSKQPDLKVFFTSSRSYDLHQQSATDATGDEKPQLDLAATGIPSLLEALYTISAEGKFECLKRIALRGLAGELKALISVLTKTPWDRHQEVRNTLELMHETMSSAVLNAFSAKLRAAFEESITQLFEDTVPTFDKEAKKFLRTLEKMHASKFLAFCRKSGEWKNNKGDLENWHERINLMYRDAVDKAFSTLNEFCNEIVQTFKLEAEKIFEDLQGTVQEQSPDRTPGMEAFIDAIKRSRETVSEQIQDEFDYFDSVIEDLRLRTTFFNKPGDCFVGQELVQAYETIVEITSKPSNSEGSTQVRRKKGRGVHAERVQVMRNALTGTDGVFKGVLGRLSHVFDDEIHRCKDSLAAILETSRVTMLRDFDNQFQPAEPHGADSIVMMNQLLAAARTAKSRLEGSVKERIREIEMWEKGDA